MSALDTGLVVVVVLLTVVVVALVRAQAATAQRLALLERRALRADRRSAPAALVTSPPDSTRPVTAPLAQESPVATTPPPVVPEPEGDAVDVRGVTVDGDATTVDLEHPAGPVLVAFLSTTCGICLGLWEQLRSEGLDGVTPVVVTKDAAVEDHDTARRMASESSVQVVMSSEAWDDYEVPGSPYFLVVDGTPGAVVAEGEAGSWAALTEIVSR